MCVFIYIYIYIYIYTIYIYIYIYIYIVQMFTVDPSHTKDTCKGAESHKHARAFHLSFPQGATRKAKPQQSKKAHHTNLYPQTCMHSNIHTCIAPCISPTCNPQSDFGLLYPVDFLSSYCVCACVMCVYAHASIIGLNFRRVIQLATCDTAGYV